jgi:hypothetical protein
LPKDTVLGIAEETSASLVADINDTEPSEPSRNSETSHERNGEGSDSLFRQYLNDKLGHLTSAERAVIEPVLMKYKHIFYREGSIDFKGTDLVEHRIVTGNAKPIRKAPYRVPFSLRK